MIGRLLIALGLLGGCGGAANPTPIPHLPTGGTANTATPTAPAKGQDEWSQRDDLINSPEPLVPAPVKLPKAERFKLNNGLEVIAVHSPRLPIVSVALAVKGGELEEPRDKVGLASFAASMLTLGTARSSATAIAERIDGVGGKLSVSAGLEATFASCSVPSSSLETCLGLTAEILLQPSFPAKEMDKARKELQSVVRQRQDSAAALADAHFANALWKAKHRRGWVLSGKSIQAISQADLRKWHKKYFVASNTTLAIAGDFEPGKLRSSLERSFGKWKKGPQPRLAQFSEPRVGGLSVRLVDKPDQTQSQIRIGHLGLRHTDRDYQAAQVMNYVLGGGMFSSRLMKVVRSEGGKTYGASSRFDRTAARGSFVIRTFTRTAETLSTIKLVLGELEKMSARGPSAREVADAVSNISGSYATSFESSSSVAGALLRAHLHGLNESYVRNFPLAVGAVNTGSAVQAARFRLDPKNIVITIVGKADEIMPQLDAAGWKVERLDYQQAIADYDRKEQALPVTEQSAKRAREILEKAIEAKGGLKRLSKLKSFSYEGAMSLSIGPQTLKGRLRHLSREPEMLRRHITIKTPVGDVAQTTVVGPSGAWMKTERSGKAEINALAETEKRTARRQMWADPEFVLQRAHAKGVTLALGTESKSHFELSVRSKTGADQVTLRINRKTYLIDEIRRMEQGQQVSARFSKYKKVGGIMVSHVRESEQATPQGTFGLKVTIDTIKTDAKAPPSSFDKPAE